MRYLSSMEEKNTIADSYLEVLNCLQMIEQNKLYNPFNFLSWQCPANAPKIFDYSILKNCLHINRLN